MKHYSAYTIDQFTKYVLLNDSSAQNWLIENDYKELIATLDAIRDDKHAFRYLINGKFFELAAFVNTIWEDSKAFKYLIDNKHFDWAACANIINGDEKAEEALLRHNKKHFVQLAHAIQGRIREDGDRNVSPWGVMQNMLSFKKAFEKDPEDRKKKK